jgi:protein SFI1
VFNLAKAIEFASRPKTYIASAALQKWRSRQLTVQNAYNFASQYHSAQLQYKTLYAWRLLLRSKIKLVRQARAAAKYFIKRKMWEAWRRRMEERKRENKLFEFLAEKKRHVFQGTVAVRILNSTSS